MDWTLEVVVVPVADVDRAIAFYRDDVGFNLDHDTRPGAQRFAQLTQSRSSTNATAERCSGSPIPTAMRGWCKRSEREQFLRRKRARQPGGAAGHAVQQWFG
jgi:hypothetical protein